MNNSLPSRGCERVQLQDVVERHQEISRSPLHDGVSRFLKVEHMDRGQLRPERWGLIEEGDLPPTFYNVFRTGHVLFPSRNPHLRRVVRPDFDGICGEKTFVLQAKSPLLQDLLPFIMQSEVLVEHAVRMKVGSTNPHVRWRDLASFEFGLPTPGEQQRIVEALQSAERAAESLRGLASKLEQMRFAHLNDFFKPRFGKGVPLPEVAKIASGGTPAKSKTHLWGGDRPWASGKDLKVRELSKTALQLTDEGWSVAKTAPEGSTLIVVRGMILAHTFPVAQCSVPMAFNQDLRALIATDDIMPDYLTLWAEWAGPWFLTRTSESSHGTKRLDSEIFETALVPVPSREVQARLIEAQSALLSAIAQSVKRRADALVCKNALVRTVLETSL